MNLTIKHKNTLHHIRNMHKILSNGVENHIINILATNFPLKSKEIHEELKKRNLTMGYKYVYKCLQNLLKQNIIEKKGLKYELSKKYISQLKSFVDLSSKNYQINQNVFMDTLNSSILSILTKKDQDEVYNKMLKLLNKEIQIKLNEWYSAYYDPNGFEFKKILKEGKLKGKNVLELGTGTGRITFNLVKHAKHVTTIDNDKDALNYCEMKAKELNIKNLTFIQKNIKNLSEIKGKYDVIVSGWSGLHYSEEKDKLIKSLYNLLRKNGILIIIEAYSGSDYMKVLNTIRARPNLNVDSKQKELKDALFQVFGNVDENIVNSYYKYPTIEKAEEAFKIELVYEEGVIWTDKDSDKLKKALNKLDNPLKISEPPLFYICKKSTN